MSFFYKPKRMVSKVPGKERVGYYATKAKAQTVELQEICDEISENNSLTSADVKGVIEAFVKVMSINFKVGKSIKLDDLGIFSPSISSPVVDSPEELTSKMVYIKSINYLPSKRLKEEMKLARFEKLGE